MLQRCASIRGLLAATLCLVVARASFAQTAIPAAGPIGSPAAPAASQQLMSPPQALPAVGLPPATPSGNWQAPPLVQYQQVVPASATQPTPADELPDADDLMKRLQKAESDLEEIRGQQ